MREDRALIFVFVLGLLFGASVWVARQLFCPLFIQQAWAQGFEEGVHVADTHPLYIYNFTNNTLQPKKRRIYIYGMNQIDVEYEEVNR